MIETCIAMDDCEPWAAFPRSTPRTKIIPGLIADDWISGWHDLRGVRVRLGYVCRVPSPEGPRDDAPWHRECTPDVPGAFQVWIVTA